MVWIFICCMFILIIGIIWAAYRSRLARNAQIILEKDNEKLKLEQSILKKEKEIAELERNKKAMEIDNLHRDKELLELARQNAELECERQILAGENMKHRLSKLEEECEKLKEILNGNRFSKPIIDAIQERIEILNSLLAAQITDNESYSRLYDNWIKKITENQNNFMNSTRLAFMASHTKFIKYLEDKGLDESEINYVCLYAIGLRGKEVGEYISLKRHYHISSEIRKKLDMTEEKTNLGIYIRRLMKRL